MIPKQEKMYQMSTICTEWSQNIPNIRKTFQTAIKCINIFQSQALKIFPKFGFLVWKQTIWQPWCQRQSWLRRPMDGKETDSAMKTDGRKRKS
jgi:hypothetical protein